MAGEIKILNQLLKKVFRRSRSRTGKQKRRMQLFETLERRDLLATAIWHNPVHPLDVSGDQPARVSAIDALLVINWLNDTSRDRLLPKQTNEPTDGPFVDTNCDGRVSALDALLVINHLNIVGAGTVGGFFTDGGSFAGPACSPQLREGSSFVTELERGLKVPADRPALEIKFQAPEFDTDAQKQIRDAFEIQVVLADGSPVSSALSSTRAAAFNWTEGYDPVTAAGVWLDIGVPGEDSTVTFDLSDLPVDTEIRVLARLINNDSDDNTSVIIRGYEFVELPTTLPPGGGEGIAEAAPVPVSSFDFRQLSDLTGLFEIDYGRTSLSTDRLQLVSQATLTNASGSAVLGPVVAVFESFSDLDVFLMRPDGILPDGRPFIDLTGRLDGSALATGQSIAGPEIRFRNESGQRFQYRLSIYGRVNTGPAGFISQPGTSIEAGKRYRYQAQAQPTTDAPLTYSVVSGPQVMSIDPQSGNLQWQTGAPDVGSHQVTIRATDVYGLFVEQSFSVQVLESLQNRPPNFITDPVIEAIASSGFEISTIAVGASPAGVEVISGFHGPRLVTINADEWTVGVYEGRNNDRFDFQTIYSTGQHAPVDALFDVGYSVDVGFSPWSTTGNINDVYGLTQGDFNGNGILDMAALTHEYDSVSRVDTYNFVVMLGDGDGQFSEPMVVGTFGRIGGQSAPRPLPRNLVAADLNGDGHLDLIATEARNRRLFFIPGNGDGTFGEMVTTVLDHAIFDFRMVDLNQDGILDLVGRQSQLGISATHELAWWPGNGDGSFGAARIIDNASTGSTTTQVRPYDIADLNGNGLMDIVSNDNRRFVRIYLATAPGEFAEPILINPGGGIVFGSDVGWMRIADFTGNGHQDIVFQGSRSSTQTRTLQLLVGDGSGDNFELRTIMEEFNSRSDNYATGPDIIDVNGNGHLDILLSGLWSNTSIQVLLNDGQGNFTRTEYAKFDFPGQPRIGHEDNGNRAVGAMLGDYNGDGFIDIAYMTQGPDFNGVGILPGTRPGEFGRSRMIDWTGRSGETYVHPGDYNGNGIIDLLLLPSGMMYLGNGDGTFAEPFPAYNVALPGMYSATADFNLDGLTDIVAVRASQYGSRVYVALANGDGTMSVSFDESVPNSFYNYSAFKIADFNNDGYPDFIAKAGVERHIDVFLNNPEAPGTFTRTFRTTTEYNGINVQGYQQSFETGDFTGNGVLDIVYGDRVDGREIIVLLAGDGHGGFTKLNEIEPFDNHYFSSTFYYAGDLQVGDLDGDGHLDILAFTTWGPRVIFGNGDGTFRPSVDHYFMDTGGYNVRNTGGYLVDMDGDGHLDLVEMTTRPGARNIAEGILRVRLGDGSGKFVEVRSIDFVGAVSQLAFADIDHDGYLDVVHVGNGNSSFVSDMVMYAGRRAGLVDLLSVDLNGDGNEEVLVVNENSDRLTIYVGDNLGRLTRQPDLLTGRAPKAVAVADLDGDGVFELITANRAGRSLTVFSGSLESGYEAVEYPAGNGVIDVVAADLNDDGLIDLIALDDSNQALLIFEGNGTRSLGEPIIVPLGDIPQRMTVGDVDGDGILDIVVALPNTQRLMILHGDGQFGFGAPVYVSLADAPSDVAIVDLNEDGRADLVATLPNSNLVSISYGLGNNQFAKPQLIRVGAKPTRITVADADQDGRMDLIVTNRGDDTVSVIYNRFDPNEVYRYDSLAIDPDDDPITYSIVDGPGGLIINSQTGALLWAASPDQVGEHSVTIAADDGRGGIGTQSFKIDVQPARENASPLFATEPRSTLGANETFVYQANALDNDRDTLHYRLVDGPEGAVIDPTTGLLTWDGRGSALQFGIGGQGGNVEIPRNEMLRPASTTIEQWFKMTELARYANLILTSRITVRVNEFNTGIFVQIDFPNHNDRIRFTVPQPMEADRWYHVALTYDADSGLATLYLDGVAIGSGTTPNPQPLDYVANAHTPVGNTDGRHNRYLLDNFRLWNYARSANEIREGLSRQYSDDLRLLVDYRFDGVDTLSVTDASPHHHNGYLASNPLYPLRVPGLASPGAVSFTISVEDGRGGYDEQSFTVNVLPELRGSIRGKLFEDLNGNGLHDNGPLPWIPVEPVLAGWELFIDTNGNGFPDPGEMTAVTDADGNYQFNGLLPGVYPIRVIPVAGYQTPPMVEREVMANQATVTDMAIEQLALGQIRGQLRTGGDDPIALWKVFADLNDNGTLDDDEPMALSDRWGNYALSGLAAGSYAIRTERPAGWLDDTGGAGLRVDLAAEAISEGHDFVLSPSNTSVTGGLHFVTTPHTTIEARQTFRYASTAMGIVNEPIVYDLSLAPDGMTIDPSGGLVAWRPTIAQVGEHSVILRATSQSGSISLHDFTLKVTAPNTAPVLSGIGLQPIHTDKPYTWGPDAFVGRAYVLDLEAQDAEQQTITYTLLSSPTAATLDASTGRLEWMPVINASGLAMFTIELSDSLGASSIVELMVQVSSDSPSITPFEIQSPRSVVGLGQEYLARLQGTDSLGRRLSWSLESGPSGMSVSSAGILNWIPGNSDLGAQLVELIASSVDGQTEPYRFTLQVVGRPVNSAPQIQSTPLASAVIGQEYRYDIAAYDADDDSLTYDLLNGPAGMSLHPTLGTLRWTPAQDQRGEFSVSVQATDPYGETTTQQFVVKATRFGGPPVITSVAATEAAVGIGYRYSVVAVDREGDPLTYRLLAAPEGMSIAGLTGEIFWTPGADFVGLHDVVIEVSDGIGGAATQAFVVRVSPGLANQPPRVISTAPRFSTVGVAYSYTFQAEDPEGTAINYSLGVAPTGMTIDGSTGVVSWTPAEEQVGPHQVTLVATDAGGAQAIETFQLDVLAENRDPIITSTPISILSVGQPLRYQVIASDPDRDPIHFELVAAPTGVTIDALGMISWKPAAEHLGENSFTVRASDPRGGQATQSFTIVVEEDTIPPIVSIVERPQDSNRNILPWQGPFTVYVRAIDNVGIASLTLTANGRDIPLSAAGTATFTFEDWTFQRIHATATAVDTSGNVASKTISFDYDFPEGWSGAGTEDIPTAFISSPSESETVFGMVTITGTAAHDKFDAYRLSYRRVDDTNYTEFASSRTAVTNGQLGVWDTSLLINDEYVIRLEVATTAGIVNVVEQNVGLSGDLKLGNFRLAFTDMVIPVAGIPIEIIRIYDTLQADRQGDFGYGWRLEYRNTDLRVGLPKSGLEDIGIYAPLRPGVKVYVNVPGQGRQGFTFNPDIRVLPGWGGNNLVLARPRFTPDPGVTSTLSAGTNSYLQVNEYSELFAPGGIPYNPASPDFGGAYMLTTRDGLTLRINGTNGELESVTNRAGNSLLLTDSGIINTINGQNIEFERDARGRITSITDFAGERLRYQYVGDNLIASIDRMGHRTTYAYDTERQNYLVSVTDPLGNTGARNDYDDNGRLKRISTDSGASVDIEADLNASLVTITDSLGNQSQIVYDNWGRVVASIDPLGNVTRNSYDAAGNLTKTVDPLGRTNTRIFDNRGNLLQSSDPNGAVNRFAYDNRGNLISHVDSIGAATQYHYDNQDRLNRIIDARGGIETREYDSSGRPIAVVDRLGGVIRYTYSNGFLTGYQQTNGQSFVFDVDRNGNIVREIAAIKSGTEVFEQTYGYQYNANGELVGIVNPRGVLSSQTLDATGLTIATTDVTGLIASATYSVGGQLTSLVKDGITQLAVDHDLLGRPTVFTAENGRSIETIYDAAGRAIQQSSEGDVWIREYDAAGQVVAQIDPQGNRVEIDYTLSGQIAEQRFSDGTVISYLYDAAGRMVRRQMGQLYDEFTYDELGRLSRIVGADGRTIEQEFDALGNIVARREIGGVEFRYQYAPSGEMIASIDQAGRKTEYLYDSTGTLRGIRNAAGHETLVVYNEVNQIASKTLPLGQKATFEYNAAGIPSSYTTFGGNTYLSEYDGQGRLKRVTDLDGNIIEEWTYTASTTTFTNRYGTSQVVSQSNRLELTTISGDRLVYRKVGDNRYAVDLPSGTITLNYSAANNLVRISHSEGQLVELEYDEAGRVGETQTESGFRRVNTYAIGYSLSQSDFYAHEELLGSLSWQYDSSQRIVGRQLPSGITETYEYDELSRLASHKQLSENGVTVITKYTYDVMDNLVSISRNGVAETLAYDANDRLLHAGDRQYIYDDDGNLQRIQSSETVTEFTYDEFDRLLRVVIRYDAGETDVIEYAYESDGLLGSRTVNGVKHVYIWDAQSFGVPMLAEVRDADGNLIRRYETDGIRYMRYFDNHGEHQLVTDQTGSIIGIVSSHGSRWMNYDAFGNIAEPSEIEIGFAGGWTDNLTGLVYFVSRWYEPKTGRFTTLDAAAGDPTDSRTLNRYIYAINDPVNRVDPYGQQSGSLAESIATLAVQSGLIAGITGFVIANAPTTVLRWLSGNRINFENQVGQTEQFLEGSFMALGQRQSGTRIISVNAKKSQLINTFESGLSIDGGLEYVSFGGTSNYFAYVGVGLGAKATSSYRPDINVIAGGRISLSYRPAIGNIFDASINPKDYRGTYVSMSGGIMGKVTFPNPLSPSGVSGKTLGRVSAISFGVSRNSASKFTHTQTIFGGGIPLTNPKGFSFSITVSGGMGISYYVPLFESDTKPPRLPSISQIVGYFA